MSKWDGPGEGQIPDIPHRSAGKTIPVNTAARNSLFSIKKNEEPRDYEDSGTQNETVPEEAKIHLSYSLFANFIERVKK